MFLAWTYFIFWFQLQNILSMFLTRHHHELWLPCEKFCNRYKSILLQRLIFILQVFAYILIFCWYLQSFSKKHIGNHSNCLSFCTILSCWLDSDKSKNIKIWAFKCSYQTFLNFFQIWIFKLIVLEMRSIKKDCI